MKRETWLYRLGKRLAGWVLMISLGIACTSKDKIEPDYRIAGRVVTAGTEWPVGSPVNLALCYSSDFEGRNPMVAWATDSSGFFELRFPCEDNPDRLRMVLRDIPPKHFEPNSMPLLTSRSMTNLRIELPALGWLRLQMNLEKMGQGGLAMIQAGSWIEMLYQSNFIERIIPWNSVMPLQVQVTYRPSIGASVVVSSYTLTVPPLDTLEWTWAP